MHSPSLEIHSKVTTLTLALMLVTLWLLLHGYHGLTGDGQIYAFQALSRIHPYLATDLYLQNASQDRFTIFSPFYAWFIDLLGLEGAARFLTLLFTAWLLAAAWNFARAITRGGTAWLAVAFLLIVAGDYGGSGVFRFAEPYLTARLPAEALIITALACHAQGRMRLGLLLALGALFVHPLIALPGLILLICLWLPIRVGIIGVAGSVVATLGVAVVTTTIPVVSHLLPIMDAAWLEVVRERSQFLFLQLWSVQDWNLNAQPFLYLAFTAVAIPDERIRKLCLAAMLVGAAGMAVALIGSLVGPIAILVQGQAWRWVWISVFMSAVLLPVTALQVWRDDKCGPLCVILLVSGWTLPVADGTECVCLALVLWVMRTRIPPRTATFFRGVSVALGIAIIAWILIKSWAIVSRPPTPSTQGFLGPTKLRDIFGLRISAAVFGGLAWWWIHSCRRNFAPMVLCVLFVSLSLFSLPASFKQSRTFASAADINEFADWINEIPPTSTVLVAPAQDVGSFVWFTLSRPNYLAIDQSAGVVFSRATAIEVRRRSKVLLPLMDPNWKMLSSLRINSRSRYRDDATTRPLTAQSLIEVCADPQLGFVISRQDVGFGPLRHVYAGVWKDWNLYDCRKVRSELPAAPVRPPALGLKDQQP